MQRRACWARSESMSAQTATTGTRHARVRGRWWWLAAGASAALTILAVGLLVAIPFLAAGTESFRHRAVVVDATVTDRTCSTGYRSGTQCSNEVTYRFDGTDHRVRKAMWGRDIGTELQIAVDPSDPERFEAVDATVGDGTFWSWGAFAAATFAVLIGGLAVGNRADRAEDGGVVFHRTPLRWVSPFTVATAVGLAVMLATQGAGLSDGAGATAVIATSSVAAVAEAARQRRGPDRLVLGGGRIEIQDRDGMTLRPMTLGPGVTWQVTQYRNQLKLRFDGPDGKLIVPSERWGADPVATIRRLSVAADHHGVQRR